MIQNLLDLRTLTFSIRQLSISIQCRNLMKSEIVRDDNLMLKLKLNSDNVRIRCENLMQIFLKMICTRFKLDNFVNIIKIARRMS